MIIIWCRYVHKETACYKQSIGLAEIISNQLKTYFPSIFDQLEKIREIEGISDGEGCIGKTPFTAMSITQDYTCDIHTDDDDVSYGFFIWLGKNGKKFFI